MRVNVYDEEITERIEVETKQVGNVTFTGLRFLLELPVTVDGQQYRGPFTHRPGDDDSSAVTFWSKGDLRPLLQAALETLNRHYLGADRA